ncbi:MAG: hypothetical protein JRN66_01195, partial [Nitrososphaerota archaeon]|nr:hypothetical protein [Nitrososphaerota archaeon]
MKLTDDKIRWIIRRKVDGGMTTAQIAELQGVDQSRIRQLWLEFRNTGKVPALKEPGRPKRVLSSWEEDKILELFALYPSNAVAMEKMLKQQGINISHDLIHRTLKDHGLAMSESNKRGRRK